MRSAAQRRLESVAGRSGVAMTTGVVDLVLGREAADELGRLFILRYANGSAGGRGIFSCQRNQLRDLRLARDATTSPQKLTSVTLPRQSAEETTRPSRSCAVKAGRATGLRRSATSPSPWSVQWTDPWRNVSSTRSVLRTAAQTAIAATAAPTTIRYRCVVRHRWLPSLTIARQDPQPPLISLMC